MATTSTHPAFRTSGDPVSLGAALASGKKVPSDVTLLLQQDHREAIAFFDWYASSADPATRRVVIRRLCAMLRAHMQAEEEVFYPAVRDATGNESMVDHAEEEHAEAKEMISEIEAAGDADEIAGETVRDLRAAIEEHVQEEEEDIFPELRQTDTDLYELGSLVAARKVEVLMNQTGRTSPDTPYMQESHKMNVSKEEAQDLFLAGLRDIHASLRQGKTMVEMQISRIESYPQVADRLREHLEDKDEQIETVEQILDSFGQTRSLLKDTAMATAGTVASMANAATEDEILKNSLATFGLLNFEIASFEALIVLGAAAGRSDEVKILQRCLNKERAMAAWLAENQRGLIMAHLQLRTEGQQASR